MNEFLSPSAREANASSPGIMVVDDDAGVLTMLDEWLRHEGFAVWLACTGEEALGLYSRRHDVIDVVLMDVCMPRLDGPTTLVGLKSINPEVRCCFMSGALGEYTEADLSYRGGASFIRKPFRLDDLAELLWGLVLPRTVKSETA
jgi:DNA-binding NtrC family response regulator